MAKKKERTEFTKKNYVSSFQLTGIAKVNDTTFSLDQRSNKSDWIYNRMNIAIDCGEESGLVFANCMGGYASERESVLYVHGKLDNGADDWKNQFQITWDDRNNAEVLENVGNSCFKTVGLEKDTKGKTVYKRFLSEYDLIEYASEHLEDGMAVNIRGDLVYQIYNGSISCQKNITSIALSNAEPQDYHARFTQTILIDEDSKGNLDKEHGELSIDGYVLEYMKDYRGHSLAVDGKKGENVPLPYTFVYKINLSNPDLAKKAIEKLFKVKKGSVNQITFEGQFISSGATITPTLDDLTDDLRELIALGIYSEEEALTACATNGNRERKMIIKRPRVRNVQNEDGTSTPVVQIFEDAFAQEDLNYFKEMVSTETEDIEDAMNPPEEATDDLPFGDPKDDDMDTSWLDDLT